MNPETRPPLRALIIEDSEDDAFLLVQALERGGYAVQSRRVCTAVDLHAALSDEVWDVVFGDLTMPGFSGEEALLIIRQGGFDMPFIFVSGTMGEETVVRALHSGAQDYIVKGNLLRLVPAVTRELHDTAIKRQYAQAEATRRRAEDELRVVEGILASASAAEGMDQALGAALARVCEVIGWETGEAWVPSADGSRLVCSPAWYTLSGDPDPLRAASLEHSLAPGKELAGRAWRAGAVQWYRRADDGQLAGYRTGLAVPVLAGDEPIAVLGFFTRGEPQAQDRLTRLVAAVAGQLGGIIQRKRAEDRLHYLAHHDTLTGLPNRVLVRDRLRQGMVEAERHGRLLAVAFVDLDRFKPINDSLGHAVGDQLLQQVAARLRASVREDDTVARLGGDEFTLILTDMAQVEDAALIAQKILGCFAEPFDVAGHALKVSMSMGMTLYPIDRSDADGLLRNADIAMYRAKEQGGNSYQFHTEEMTARIRDRLALEQDLRQAIDKGEFSLQYQPIMDLASGSFIAVEALLRWHHPRRGHVPPDLFIPLAEETGIILDIGEWVLSSACAQSAAWARQGLPRMHMSVNVSVREFRQQDFVPKVKRIVARSGCDPACLALEITETLLIDSAVIDSLRALSHLGIQLSIDDFGTGYSSLAYLRRFPLDYLKIDRSFVRDVPFDTDAVAVVIAIITMAHALGLKTVAEGVETGEQLEFLRIHGCDMAQGYYLGRPACPGDFASLPRGRVIELPWSARQPREAVRRYSGRE